MTLRTRIDRLEGKRGGQAYGMTPALRKALDCLAAAIASGGEAEAQARRELAEILSAMDPWPNRSGPADWQASGAPEPPATKAQPEVPSRAEMLSLIVV